MEYIGNGMKNRILGEGMKNGIYWGGMKNVIYRRRNEEWNMYGHRNEALHVLI